MSHSSAVLKRKVGSRYAVIITWLCCMTITFVTFLPVNRVTGDDTNFAIWISQSSSPAQWVWKRYLNWSGRVFSESAAAVFIPLDQMWWRIMNTLMVALLVYSMISLVSEKITVVSILMGYAGLWLIAPSILLDSIYWVAGSFAYLWPTALAFFSGTMLIRIYRGHSVSCWGWYILSALLASLGVEQIGLCLCAFGILTVLSIWLRNRNISIQACLLTVVSMMGVIIEVISPGSHRRTVSETKNWYPEFETLPIYSKIMRGIVWQFSYTVNYLLLLFVILTFGLLAVTMHGRYSSIKGISDLTIDENSKSLPFSLIECIICLISAMFVIVMSSEIIQIRDILMNFPTFGKTTFVRWLLPLAFWTVIFIGLAVIVIWYSHSPMMIAFIFLAAIASSAVMYFSPTIYASGSRSMFISSLLIVVLIHIMRVEHPNRIWHWIIGMPALVNFLHLAYTLWLN